MISAIFGIGLLSVSVSLFLNVLTTRNLTRRVRQLEQRLRGGVL